MRRDLVRGVGTERHRRNERKTARDDVYQVAGEARAVAVVDYERSHRQACHFAGKRGKRGVRELERCVAAFANGVEAVEWKLRGRRVPIVEIWNAVAERFRGCESDRRIHARERRLREREAIGLREIEIAAAHAEVAIRRRERSAEERRAEHTRVIFTGVRREHDRIG